MATHKFVRPNEGARYSELVCADAESQSIGTVAARVQHDGQEGLALVCDNCGEALTVVELIDISRGAPDA